MDVEQFQSSIELAVSMAIALAPWPFLASVVVGALSMSSRGRLGQVGSAIVSVTGGGSCRCSSS